MIEARDLAQAMERLNQGVFTEAEAICREVLQNEPENAKAWHLCGITHAQRGQLEEARDCFISSTESAPDKALYHYNLALAYKGLHELDQAADSYRAAIAKNEMFLEARNNLGNVLLELDRTEEACDCFRELVERFPENAAARHMLASLTGENAPERCHDDYVRDLFDEAFAKTFEQQLEQMEYKAPSHVGDAFQALDNGMVDLDVLDAGCGTGLCGPIFRKVARRLVGVDLSEDMLTEAGRLKIYDETAAGEITAYMQTHPGSMDLIIAADTLCYFGKLNEVIGAAFGCLKDNGILIFTVELSDQAGEDHDYQLQPSGRYRHAEPYVKQAIIDAGFEVVEISSKVLRTESGQPVDGLVATAAKRLT